MRLRRMLLACLLGWLVLEGCLVGANPPKIVVVKPNVPAEVVDFPHVESSVVWLPDGQLMIRPESPGRVYKIGERASYLLWDGASWEKREFPLESTCTRYRIQVASQLPDGRLGIVQDCSIYADLNQRPVEELTFVLAYDWRTGVIEPLVKQPIPPIGGLGFSWNPDMTRGVQEAGSLLSTIIWLTPEKAEPMEVTIRDGLRSWSLAENFQIMLSRQSDTRRIGRAGSPAWSPDGRIIAFFASADAVGRQGISRAAGEYKLYLMAPEHLEPEPILDKLYFADGLVWSPDGRWLAFAGQHTSTCAPEVCLWIFSPERRELVQVTGDAVTGPPSWSPDGTRIVTTRQCEECGSADSSIELGNGEVLPLPSCRPCSYYQIVIYDLSTVVTREQQ